MNSSDNRCEQQKKTCVQAFASDIDDTMDIKCIIRDLSNRGCMIVASYIHELPEMIQLMPENFKQPLTGKIVWRKDKFAGVSFLSPASDAVLASMQDPMGDGDDDEEPMLLEAAAGPLSYNKRLARYQPRVKIPKGSR
jgi:hypothetical protein